MANTTETSSALLIRTARMDARKDVSKWRWGTLGVCLSFLPFSKIIVFGIASVIVFFLVPTIDLSAPERVQIYSEHPALYTEQFRKTVKKLRFISIFCGWIVGITILNPF